MKTIVEYSEDRSRSSLRHIRSAITELTGLSGHRCVQCGRAAAALVNVSRSPLAVCERHADDWRGLSRLERRRASTTWGTR
jgi:hypothetical protein